jgi:hypothetical protein
MPPGRVGIFAGRLNEELQLSLSNPYHLLLTHLERGTFLLFALFAPSISWWVMVDGLRGAATKQKEAIIQRLSAFYIVIPHWYHRGRANHNIISWLQRLQNITSTSELLKK